MKYYVAELVATGIAFLCALTNHAGACWVWRKLMPLDNWAGEVLSPTPPARHVTASTVRCNCHEPRITFGGDSASVSSLHYCPAHGMVRDA